MKLRNHRESRKKVQNFFTVGAGIHRRPAKSSSPELASTASRAEARRRERRRGVRREMRKSLREVVLTALRVSNGRKKTGFISFFFVCT